MAKHGIEWWVATCVLAAALAGCGESAPSAPQPTATPAEAAAPAPAPAADAAPHGVGIVQSVDTSAGTVTIAHQPIASIGWPAMTMSFKVAKPELLEQASVGETIEFTLDGKDMSASITSLREAH